MRPKKTSRLSKGRVWGSLHRLISSIEKCEETVFKELGLSVNEYQVLKAIMSLDDKVTPTSIANLLDRSPNFVTLLLNSMEKERLIDRKRDLEDRRSLRIIITTQGEKKFKSALGPATKVRNELLSVLSREELSMLTQIIDKMSDKSFNYRNITDKIAKTSV